MAHAFMTWMSGDGDGVSGFKAKHELDTPEKVTELFSNVTTDIQLHMPAVPELVNGGRFDINEDAFEFLYFGREKFAQLVEMYQMMKPTKSVLRVLGNIGAGKSHLLAAFVIYLHLLRKINPNNAKRVVYIPSCSLWSEKPAKRVVSALKFAFPEMDEKTFGKTWETIENFVEDQPSRSIVFICDDWNFLCPEVDKHDSFDITKRGQLRDQLKALTSSQYRIEALSAGSAESTRTKGEGLDQTKFFELFGGLSDSEWTAWVEHQQDGQHGEQGQESTFWASILRDGKQELSNNDAMDVSGGDDEDVSDLELLRDFTGGVPLNLRDFLKCEGATMAQKMEAFTDGKTFGLQIASDLRKFTTAFLDSNKPIAISSHISLMHSALIERKCEMALELIDQRYFFYKNGAVHPVSGFVRKTMAIILQEHAQKEYFAGLTAEWVCGVLNSESKANKCVKGFAYEEYCLALLIKEPHRLHKGLHNQSITIVRFDGNHPPTAQLKVEGATLFWPNKFNLRHVDAVVRWVTNDSYVKFVHTEGPPKPGRTANSNKRTASSTETTEVKTNVTILPVQVTLQTPIKHQKSLQFFDEDASRYVKVDETAKYVFVWVVAETQDAPPFTKEGVTQHVTVITVD